MRRTRLFGLSASVSVSVSVLWLLAAGCGSPSAGGTGGAGGETGGTSGATGGTGGGTGGTSGTGGGSSGFVSVPPCTTEALYATAGTTVNFGVNGTAAYDPKCLKVSVGSIVTFVGDFSAHPLSPSTMRGTVSGNPITNTGSGSRKSVTFPAPGAYAYYCDLHGPSDGAAGMVGVVWVQ